MQIKLAGITEMPTEVAEGIIGEDYAYIGAEQHSSEIEASVDHQSGCRQGFAEDKEAQLTTWGRAALYRCVKFDTAKKFVLSETYEALDILGLNQTDTALEFQSPYQLQALKFFNQLKVTKFLDKSSISIALNITSQCKLEALNILGVEHARLVQQVDSCLQVQALNIAQNLGIGFNAALAVNNVSDLQAFRALQPGSLAAQAVDAGAPINAAYKFIFPAQLAAIRHGIKFPEALKFVALSSVAALRIGMGLESAVQVDDDYKFEALQRGMPFQNVSNITGLTILAKNAGMGAECALSVTNIHQINVFKRGASCENSLLFRTHSQVSAFNAATCNVSCALAASSDDDSTDKREKCSPDGRVWLSWKNIILLSLVFATVVLSPWIAPFVSFVVFRAKGFLRNKLGFTSTAVVAINDKAESVAESAFMKMGDSTSSLTAGDTVAPFPLAQKLSTGDGSFTTVSLGSSANSLQEYVLPPYGGPVGLRRPSEGATTSTPPSTAPIPQQSRSPQAGAPGQSGTPWSANMHKSKAPQHLAWPSGATLSPSTSLEFPQGSFVLPDGIRRAASVVISSSPVSSPSPPSRSPGIGQCGSMHSAGGSGRTFIPRPESPRSAPRLKLPSDMGGSSTPPSTPSPLGAHFFAPPAISNEKDC